MGPRRRTLSCHSFPMEHLHEGLGDPKLMSEETLKSSQVPGTEILASYFSSGLANDSGEPAPDL